MEHEINEISENTKHKISTQNLTKIANFLSARDENINQTIIKDLLIEASRLGTSDVHFEPLRTELLVRFRIDGILYDIFNIPKSKEQNISSCIKIMADMDITERRLPQDGRIEIKIGDDILKIRAATMQQIFGEKIVIRIFGSHLDLFKLESLGFTPENRIKYESIISKKSGIIIVSGPTNSGKTTTLYSSLNKLNSPEKNIVSVEDPIEYIVDRVNQIQVNPQINFDFATVLRGVLRQDPNIIIVGEIRDFETAQMVVRAALTGHLILTTFHSHRTTTCITRLIDMGIFPFLVASSLNGVLVQKLARRICIQCIEEINEDSDILKGLKHYKGKGCAFCNFSGYKGLIALHELLTVSGSIRKLIQSKAEGIEIFKQARLEGMKTLREDAIEKVKQGIISLEEAINITSD